MAQELGEIPLGVGIVNPDGTIALFFRLLWEQLRGMVRSTPTVTAIDARGQTDAIATATAFNVVASGNYRVSYALLKTIADGAGSSLTVTIGWVSRGIACTHTFAAFTTDTFAATQSDTLILAADADSPITYAIAYASTTPHQMTYDATLTVEQLSA